MYFDDDYRRDRASTLAISPESIMPQQISPGSILPQPIMPYPPQPYPPYHHKPRPRPRPRPEPYPYYPAPYPPYPYPPHPYYPPYPTPSTQGCYQKWAHVRLADGRVMDIYVTSITNVSIGGVLPNGRQIALDLNEIVEMTC